MPRSAIFATRITVNISIVLWGLLSVATTARAFAFVPFPTARAFARSTCTLTRAGYCYTNKQFLGTTTEIMSSTPNNNNSDRRRTSPRKKKTTAVVVGSADVVEADLVPSSRNAEKKAKALPVKSSTTKTKITTASTRIPTNSSSNSAISQKSTTGTVSVHSTTLLEEWISHEDASFHHFPSDEAAQIRQALLKWYHVHRRKLPWRGDSPPYEGSTAGTNTKQSDKKPKPAKPSATTTTKATTTKVKAYNQHATSNNNNTTIYTASAYGTWVSEIMLQQTRVEAVIPYWLKWMDAFPTPQALADATEEQVNAHWAGLGFYRRARMLHAAAKVIVNDYNGKLPQTVPELESIPGIGPYTAAAIASIAFGVSVPVVDGNVCRVLSRLRGVAHHIKAPIFKDKLAWELAGQIINAGDDGSGDAGDVNQAMMELGATYCAPSGTGVDERDPLKDFYMSTNLGAAYFEQYALPTPENKKERKHLQSLIDQTLQPSPNEDQPMCALCERERITTVLEQLAESMEDNVPSNSASIDDNNSLDAAKRCGHTVFPMTPPKLSKREEVIAVAAISTTIVGPKATTKSKTKKGESNEVDNDNTYWLLVKRPKKGLLAGQWEFPSTCVWNSSDTDGATQKDSATSGKKGVKRKAPSSSLSSPAAKAKSKTTIIEVPIVKPGVRQKALAKLLDDILSNNEVLHEAIDGGKLTKLKGSPIEHVFSHVRHTMWVEHQASTQTSVSAMQPIEWVSSTDKREVKWMRESDMKKAGVTSGVKKILKAVKDEQQKKTAKSSFFQPKPKPRKK